MKTGKAWTKRRKLFRIWGLLLTLTLTLTLMLGCGQSNSSSDHSQEGIQSADTSAQDTGTLTEDSTDTSAQDTGTLTEDSPDTSAQDTGTLTEDSPDTSAQDTGTLTEDSPDTSTQDAGTLDRDGSYTTAEDVSLYLTLYGELPENFITKKEARALGWSGGSLEPYAPGKCIGGDRFGNYEGILPDGREYHECDIDTLGAESRGAKRLVFSGDGLIYYTEDHYESFTLLYGEE